MLYFYPVALRLCFFIPLFLLFSGANRVNAQNRPIAMEWAKSYGGSSLEYSQACIQTSDGGFVFASLTMSTNGQVTNPTAGWLAWIVRTDSQGKIIWQRTYGKSTTTPHGIIQTKDGGFAICGSAPQASNPNAGILDFWILKIDANGNMEWEKTYGGSEEDQAYKIIQTKDGNYVIAGNSNSKDGDVVIRSGFKFSYYNYWALKLDATGNIIWSQTYGGNGSDDARDVIETDDGGLAMIGGISSNDLDVTDYKGNGDIWLVKTDKNGVLQWAKGYGGSGADYAYSVKQASDGGYVIGGITSSNDINVTGYHGGGNYDFWVAKTTATGAMVWSKCYGGSSGDYMWKMNTSKYGGYILAGSTTSTDGDVHKTSTDSDYWVVKIDDAGNLVWSQYYGGSYQDYVMDLTETLDGGVMAMGTSISFDKDVKDHIGDYDTWCIKLRNKIATTRLSNLTYCPGESLTIRDTLFGAFNTNNTFSVQLSDANGSFATPLTIASFANYKDSVFQITLPGSITAGTKYRMRIVSSSPEAFYTDNGQDITIGIQTTATPNFLGNDTTVCDVAAITLQAPVIAGSQYLWSDNSTGDHYTVTTSGSYAVKITNGSGCASFDTIQVQMNTTPVFTLGSDTSACAGNTVQLQPTLPTGNYLWSNGARTPATTTSSTGWYWLQVSDGACSKRDSLLFTLKPQPVIALGNDTAICEGTQLVLDATDINSGTTYLWQDGAVTPTYVVSQPGLYTVHVNANGCVADDRIMVSTITAPAVELGNDTTLCNGQSLLLNAYFPGATYAWSSGAHDAQLPVTTEGTFAVTVSNACGTTNDQVHVSVKECTCPVYMPTAFSPNSDGKNDQFKPTARCTVSNYELKIFNRYGQSVFISHNPAIGWDGKFNGQPQPMGSFVWMLQYKDPIAGKMVQQKGVVMVVR